MAVSPGSTIGPYEVVALLGTGGMGEVYRARDARLGRDVALKLIRSMLVTDPSSAGTSSGTGGDTTLDRLLREATLASALNHPNIVTIYETGVVGSDRYVAMELVEGMTLRALLTQGIDLPRAVAIVRQVAEALAVAHAAHIIHRDIKPDNVMVRPDGYVKLLDFGLARHQVEIATGGTTGHGTKPGLVLGTIGYMAPEQARGEALRPEADIFALGVLLYELLVGRHPFKAASHLGTLHALMWETPEPPSLVNPEIPRSMDQLILEMLRKDPLTRPGAGEVMYRLSLAHEATAAIALSSAVVSRPRAAAPREIVGRDQELDVLVHELERAQKGKGRLVVVSAEAGMGKTTLVDAFVRHLEQEPDPVRIGRGRCSERLAGSEAYLPVLEALETLQRSEQFGSLSRLVRALAPSWYVQIVPATNDSSAARLAAETAGGSQERLKRELAALLEEVGRMQTVVLCFDDVHWADPSTTDLIGYLARRIDTTRLMIVVTCRPSDLAQLRNPFLTLKLDLLARGFCREIVLGSLDETAVARYIALQFPENAFPDSFTAMIHERTEGHPLFMADLLRDLRRRQVLRKDDGRWIVAEDLSRIERDVPQTVRSFVERKIAALDDEDRKLLGAASVQGVDFDTGVLASVLQRPEEDVEDRLDRLEREHALVAFVQEFECEDRSLTLKFRFAHHLYHTAFYEGLRATRRVALSRAIAERLVARVGDAPCDCAADVALLFETARDGVRAAEYWNRAAQAAARLYAHDETARLAMHGLDLLRHEPEGEAKAEAELALQMTYGLALKTSRGYAVPEVGAAYARARDLCRQVKNPAAVIPVLIGLSAHHVVSGEITTSRDVALEMLDLFERLGDPNLQMIGQWSLGAAMFHLGELEVAHAHLGRALELYDPAFHARRVWETGIEPGVFCRSEYGRTLTLLGYPDQGLSCVHEAVRQARALEHPQPLAFALLFEMLVHTARREPADVLDAHRELAALCTRHGIAQELQWGNPLRGRAVLDLGDTERGLREIQEGLAAHTITRSALLRPFYCNLLAGALLRARRADEAERALAEARTSADATSQHAFDAEQRRLEAELASLRRDGAGAEAAYRDALEIARRQSARWLELRAARGFAQFLAFQGRTDAAREVLQPVLAELSEGHSTGDYQLAVGLLASL